MRAFILAAFSTLIFSASAQATVVNIYYGGQTDSFGINALIVDAFYQNGNLHVGALDGETRVVCRIPKTLLEQNGIELVSFMKHLTDKSANSTLSCRGQLDNTVNNWLTVEASELKLLIIGRDL